MKSNVRDITFTESEISADIRKYFEQSKKDYEAEKIQPGEFTITMFERETGQKNSVSLASLANGVRTGKLTMRWGRSARGIPCQLYKVVK